ncbi:hypothetical protein EDB83DRAFT_2567819 [Lactarius deliciosus]|nr:hypothetical protein EDB83DRAFT_2567819 [Lactarius deliciosus]
MPSPSSEYAPYYSGRRGTFEIFLQEFESLADRCMLTNPQQVETITRYMAPSVCKVLRSVDGFCSRDWSHFRQFLVDVFGTPPHLVAREKLLNFVRDSSRKRMFCEDDVLQYYQQFSSFAAPIANTCHLSEMQRNAVFWCGFHPTDRMTLQPALLAKYPYQPYDDPFPLYDVLSCAHVAFAYHDPHLSWPQEEPFKHQSVRREQPVSRDEHIPPVTYGLRVVECNDTPNDETTGDPSKLHTSSPDPRPPSDSPSSFSTSMFRPQTELTPAHSEDHPELEPTLDLSTPPSSLPHPTPSSVSYSLAPSTTDDDPELTILPSASSTSSVELECPSSPMQWTTEDHLEPEPVHEPSIVPISHSLPSTLSLDSPNTGNIPEIAPVSPAEPHESRVPLLSTFPVLPASSNFSSAMLSPSLVLGDLELESTAAPTIVNLDTVPLGSPECLPPPIDSTVITPPSLLKLSPNGPLTPTSPNPLGVTPVCSTSSGPGLAPVAISLLPLPIDFTILTPPGLLRLSPNVPITPPSPSPLEATRLTMFGPISPPLEVLTNLRLIGSQVSTPLESSPLAPSTQSNCRISTPVNSPFTPLQITPSCSPSLAGPHPAHVDFASPFSISAISVSDLGKTLSTHTHEFWSNFVFDPGGLVFALDPTHKDVFRRNPRTRGTSPTASSTFVTAPSRTLHQVKTVALVSRSAPTVSVFDNTNMSAPLRSLSFARYPILAPLTSINYSSPHSSLLSLAGIPSCPSSFPLAEESVFRHAPFLDPRLLHRINLYRSPHHFLLHFFTFFLSFVSLSIVALTLVLQSLPASLSVRPSSTHTTRVDDPQRKSRPRGSFIITHDTLITTLVQGHILIHFSAETPAKLARRSLTGDGQDFDPPGGVRIARALGPQSCIFGVFGLGPASRGSAAILVSHSHGVAPHYRPSRLPLPSRLPWTLTPIASQTAPLLVSRRIAQSRLFLSRCQDRNSPSLKTPLEAVRVIAPVVVVRGGLYCHNAIRFLVSTPISLYLFISCFDRLRAPSRFPSYATSPYPSYFLLTGS